MNVTASATYRTRRAAQVARVTFTPKPSYVLPDGITSTRTFDDATVCPEAHWRMIDRMSIETPEFYEG